MIIHTARGEGGDPTVQQPAQVDRASVPVDPEVGPGTTGHGIEPVATAAAPVLTIASTLLDRDSVS